MAWSDCEPFDPEQWEIVWHGGSHHDCEPPPPRPPAPPMKGATAVLKPYLQRHADRAHRIPALALALGLSDSVVRDRLRSLVDKEQVFRLRTAEGHVVFKWAGKATKNYTLRQPDKRIRLQGAA